MRESWTDDRLDYLNRRVDDGFKQVDERLEQVDKRLDRLESRVERMDVRFDQLNEALNSGFRDVNKLIVQLSIAMGSMVVVLFAALLATML